MFVIDNKQIIKQSEILVRFIDGCKTGSGNDVRVHDVSPRRDTTRSNLNLSFCVKVIRDRVTWSGRKSGASSICLHESRTAILVRLFIQLNFLPAPGYAPPILFSTWRAFEPFGIILSWHFLDFVWPTLFDKPPKYHFWCQFIFVLSGNMSHPVLYILCSSPSCVGNLSSFSLFVCHFCHDHFLVS